MPSASPAAKAYRRRVLIASAAYFLLVFGSDWVARGGGAPVAARYALALLSAVPVVAMFAALGRYLAEERDEYIRSLVLRQVLWATGATLAFATLAAFWESVPGAARIHIFWVPIVWLGCFGVAGMARRVRP